MGKKVGEKNKSTIPEPNGDGLLAVRIGYAAVPAGQICSGERGVEDTEQLREVSGDTAVSCRLPDGSVALILSDGMGKGKEAAAESSLVVGMLRRRLKQGTSVNSAIREVNRYLLEKGEKKDGKNSEIAGVTKESFATVDLAIIDRSTGCARFYKMGAAPSYVVRGRKQDTRATMAAKAAGTDTRLSDTEARTADPDARLSGAEARAAGADSRGIRKETAPRRVRKLAKPMLPVGIIPTLELTHVTARLHAGDMIVMMSDGITDMAGLGNDDWIGQMLSGVPEEEGPRQLAGRILREGQSRCGVRETDDATVMVAIIR